MKLAILSDIHGNVYALQQVLLHAERIGVKKLLILGDIIGYYYHPDKVLSLLSKWEYELIRGNHEELLQKVINGELKMSFLTKKYGNGHQFAIDKLSTEQLDEILTAPDQKEVIINATKILMCHGSHWDPNYYLYPDTNEEILNRSNDVSVDFVFVGHSHYPFVHQNKKNTLINVGSVGQSRKKGGIGNWVLLDSKTKEFQLMSTSYDVSILLGELEQINPDIPYLQTILKRNNNEI